MANTPAPLDPDLVQEFVGKAHGDFGWLPPNLACT